MWLAAVTQQAECVAGAQQAAGAGSAGHGQCD